MPRLPADPVGRLAKLEAALAALGRGKAILNADEMARTAGMTWRNMKITIDRDTDFPIVQRGDMGVPWQFDARHVLKHLIASAKAVQAERERRKGRVDRLAGLGGDAAAASPSGGGGAGPGTAAREMLEDAKALGAVLDLQTRIRAEKQKQGELVERKDVDAFLWDFVTELQSGVLAIPTKLDRSGKWDPLIRRGVEDELANLLVTLRGRLEKWIDDRDAR